MNSTGDFSIYDYVINWHCTYCNVIHASNFVCALPLANNALHSTSYAIDDSLFCVHVLQFTGRCLPLFGGDGSLRVPVHQVYPLDQANEAHNTMRTNRNIGKLIIEIP